MKAAVIFGATGQIGQAVTRKFLQGYDCLILVGRSEKNLKAIQEQCLLAFPEKNISIVQFDPIVSSVQAMVCALDNIPVGCRELSVVNLIASQLPAGPIWKNDLGEWQQTLELNLMLNVAIVNRFIGYAIRHQLPLSLVLFSGGGAAYARPNFSAYAVSKTAVLRLVENTYEELKLHGYDKLIQINAVAPGCVKSQLTEEILAAGAKIVGEKAYAEARQTMQDGGEIGRAHV